MRILIAEDESDIWIPYKITLEKRGHIVDIAQNGEECIEMYKTAKKMKQGRKRAAREIIIIIIIMAMIAVKEEQQTVIAAVVLIILLALLPSFQHHHHHLMQ